MPETTYVPLVEAPRAPGDVPSIGELAVWAAGIERAAALDGSRYRLRLPKAPNNKDVAEAVECWLHPDGTQASGSIDADAIRAHLPWLTKQLRQEAAKYTNNPHAQALARTTGILEVYSNRRPPRARELFKAGTGKGLIVRRALGTAIFGDPQQT